MSRTEEDILSRVDVPIMRNTTLNTYPASYSELSDQAVQIKAARPALVPLQSLKLSIVAEIPDEITGARLAIEESGERLDAVSIHQQHWQKLMFSQRSDKTLNLAKTSIYRNSNFSPQERRFLPGASAGVSVPEKP
jgi:hypothetical protein